MRLFNPRLSGIVALWLLGSIVACSGSSTTHVDATAADGPPPDRAAVDPAGDTVTGADAAGADVAGADQGSTTSTLVDGDYATDCEVADDCVSIVVGEVCSLCQCTTVAISREDLAEYEADAGAIRCPDGDYSCDCLLGAVGSAETDCDQGACIIKQ